MMNNEVNTSKKGTIGGILFIIWFISSIVLLLIMSEKNTNYTVMIFGQYFLVFGLIAFFKNKGTGRLISIPFILIGLASVIIPYLMLNPEILGIPINWESVIALLLILVFVIAGISLIVIPIINTKKLKEKCNVEIEATIIENKSKYNNGNILYCPIYEFTYNETKYNVTNNIYTNINVKPVDTIVKIKINPNNPEEFYNGNKFLLICIIIGIIFLCTSIPVLIIFLKDTTFVK